MAAASVGAVNYGEAVRLVGVHPNQSADQMRYMCGSFISLSLSVHARGNRRNGQRTKQLIDLPGL
jgi:hypothetical protein